MNKLLSLLTIVIFFGLADTQGFPTLPGVIDLKEPDINFTTVRQHLNSTGTVVELKEPSIEEKTVEEPGIEKVEEKIIESEEVEPIEREELVTVEKSEEKIIEAEEVEPIEREELGIAEEDVEKDTEIIQVNPEENIIFYIPDFGQEEEEDIIIDADASDIEHEIIGGINDLEGINLTEYYHPYAIAVNPSEYEVVDHPHPSDSTDEDDAFVSLRGDDSDNHYEHEIAKDVNDLDSVNLTEYYNPKAINVNPAEYETVDHPHPSDSPDESDLVDYLDTEKISEVEDVHDLKSVDLEGYAHEYEETDHPPEDYDDSNDWGDNDWDDLDADNGTN